VKSPAAQLFTPTRKGGSVGTLPREWFPSRQTPIPQNIIELVHPPVGSDQLTDCSPGDGYVCQLG